MIINKEFREKEKAIRKYEKEKKKELEIRYKLKIKKCKLLLIQSYYLIIDINARKIKYNRIFLNVDDVERYLKYKHKK